MKRLNRVGQKFGNWTVIGNCLNRLKSLCKCKCGIIKEVHNATLRDKRSTQCKRCGDAQGKAKSRKRNKLVLAHRSREKQKSISPVNDLRKSPKL